MKQINDSGSKQLNIQTRLPTCPLVTIRSPENKTQMEQLLNVLSSEQIQQLKVSEQKMKDFLNKIGHIKNTPILKSIKSSYKEQKLGKLTSTMILQFCQTRVSKMAKNHKLKKNWGVQDIYILLWLLSKYMEFMRINAWQNMNDSDWKFISSMIPGSNSEDCQFKWLNLNKNKLGDYLWTQEQTIILSKLVNQYGLNNWKIISQRLYFQNSANRKIFRTAKQCKQRWSCYQNPAIKKGQWTQEEDKILMRQVYRNGGLRRWSQISKILCERTQNAIKNRYKLLLDKEETLYMKTQAEDNLDLIRNFLQRHNTVPQIQLGSKQEESSVPEHSKNLKSQTSLKYEESNQFHWRSSKNSAFIQYSEQNHESIKTSSQIQGKDKDLYQTLSTGFYFFNNLWNGNNQDHTLIMTQDGHIRFLQQLNQPIISQIDANAKKLTKRRYRRCQKFEQK